MTTLQAQEILSRRGSVVARVYPHVKRGLLFCLTGLVISILMAWALGMWGEPAGGTSLTAAVPERGKIWELYSWSASGSLRIYSKREGQSWTGYQVTGPPDSPMGSDS